MRQVAARKGYRRTIDLTDPDPPDDVPPLVPAGTVVVLRDGPGGLEVLMLQRNAELAFAGGMWVFPGGRIDPGDLAGDEVGDDDLLQAARRASAREAREEAGLRVEPHDLVWFSHWTPPERPGKRFATWFFVVALPAGHDGEIRVDGGEIVAYRWITPADAHRRRDEGALELSPPTWITLWQLRPHATVAEAVAAFAETPPEYFATRIGFVDDEIHALYAGDAGYEDGDPHRPGPRHRLRMTPRGWTYER